MPPEQTNDLNRVQDTLAQHLARLFSDALLPDAAATPDQYLQLLFKETAPSAPPSPAVSEEVMEQIRVRLQRRTELEIREERRRLLNRLLTFADNLERALPHTDENESLRAGLQVILDDVRAQLAQEGVELMEALGQPFDPTLHEAVATDGTEGDLVVKVLQTGYTLNGDLLRPARVIVGSITE
jgi:hypothetical protein